MRQRPGGGAAGGAAREVVEVVEVEEEEKGKEMRASQVEVGGNINLPPPRPRKTNRNLWETATLP